MPNYDISDYVEPIEKLVSKVNIRSRTEACPVGKAFIVRGSSQSAVAGQVYPIAKGMAAKFKINKMDDGAFQVTRVS